MTGRPAFAQRRASPPPSSPLPPMMLIVCIVYYSFVYTPAGGAASRKVVEGFWVASVLRMTAGMYEKGRIKERQYSIGAASF
jgi:hypothetical protein